MKSCELVIIGAGPAGLTAGIYASRSGIKTILITKDIGGTANTILDLENWPGYKGNGAKLMKQFYDHLKNYNIEIITAEVSGIEKEKNNFVIKTSKETIECKSVILATGTKRRKLKIPGEEELIGKGVSYCATCDGFFFKNKIVGIIGGSDCAATTAIALSEIAKELYIFYRKEDLRCEEINKHILADKKNVKIIYNTTPVRILGKEKVEGIEMKDEKGTKVYNLDGVFIEIGSTPVTDFASNLKLKLDEENAVIVDEEMNTSVKGIFAAGDVTHHKLKQVVVASAQGAIAAKNAGDFIKNEN